MRRELITLLAAAVLTRFVLPAAAQAPQAGVGLPSGKAWGMSTANSTSILWFTYPWCPGDPDTFGLLVESEVKQGPIARALGLPVPAAQEMRVAAAAQPDFEPDNSFVCNASFVDPSCSGSSTGFQAANNGAGAGNLCGLCQYAEFPSGSDRALPPVGSDCMAVIGCDSPDGAINWNCAGRPVVQFSGGLSFTTVFGSNGFAGRQNVNQFMGVGSSAWIGCTTDTGLEIRAGFGFVGSQQLIDPRR
jgi:hypothetical protein